MAVIKESIINTGTMSFSSLKELDAFIVTIPSLSSLFDTTRELSLSGQIIGHKSTQLAPNSFNVKMTYVDEAASTAAERLYDINTIQQAMAALGWTVNRTISYVYD